MVFPPPPPPVDPAEGALPPPDLSAPNRRLNMIARLAEMSPARRALFPRLARAVATTPPVPPGAFADDSTEPRREHSVDDRSDQPCACVARALDSARPRGREVPPGGALVFAQAGKIFTFFV